jgi:hypothetical protein
MISGILNLQRKPSKSLRQSRAAHAGQTKLTAHIPRKVPESVRGPGTLGGKKSNLLVKRGYTAKKWRQFWRHAVVSHFWVTVIFVTARFCKNVGWARILMDLSMAPCRCIRFRRMQGDRLQRPIGELERWAWR